MISQMKPFLLLAIATLSAGAAAPAFGQNTSSRVSCRVASDLQNKHASGLVFVDVRSAEEFSREHIPGAINVPSTEIKDTTRIPKGSTLIIYCGEASCSRGDQAAGELASRGYGSVRVLGGGLAAWKQLGYQIEPKPAESRISTVSTDKVGGSSSSAALLDVRSAREFTAGHIPGAINIPLETLTTAALPPGKTEWIVYDRLPARARKAAAMISSQEVKAHELGGGITVWAAQGRPLETGGGLK